MVTNCLQHVARNRAEVMDATLYMGRAMTDLFEGLIKTAIFALDRSQHAECGQVTTNASVEKRRMMANLAPHDAEQLRIIAMRISSLAAGMYIETVYNHRSVSSNPCVPLPSCRYADSSSVCPRMDCTVNLANK